MTSAEILLGLTIHLLIPLIGLLLYLTLVRKMKREKIKKPPFIHLFLLFATYGGLLLVALTSLLWEWSAMASLGALYLLIGAPLVLAIICYRNYRTRENSKYHMWAYKSGLFYYIIAPLIMITIILFE